MLRNREVRILLFVMSGIGLICTALAVLLSPITGWIVLICSAALMACCFLFTRWRYREIEKLSGYLRRISGGNVSLDVRDNEEGELSILKNDIFKVTSILSEQRSLLQKEKEQLTDAISDISHQLKTPLTSMVMMADLLSTSKLPEAKRLEFTRNIQAQLERMEWLVSSLLKLSKIDAGTVLFKKDQVSVPQLIQKALESVLIPMDIKQQNVTVQGEEGVSFVGDLNWTLEAVINVLKNGVEHTPEGGKITITFDENALFTEIVIADNGKGIPKEDIAYIFKRFYKGKNASDDSVGIGLAMAHSIIKSQGGNIEATSVEGKGTQFRIQFYRPSM